MRPTEHCRENLINFKRKEWIKYVNTENEHRVSDEGFDLLTKMLQIDHTQRINASEALLHPFFDSIRADDV